MAIARISIPLEKQAAPVWAQRLVTALEGIFNGLVSVKLRVVDAVADLPSAADWSGRQIYCKDVGGGANRIVISDGTNWIRTDTGATV